MRIKVVLLASLLLGSAASAQAQINCGATITQDTVLMPSDPVVSGPCATNPVLRVIGPAELDMNGQSVSCSNSNIDGIRIEGNRAEIFNGAVVDCRTGFTVYPDINGGGHKLYNLVARDNDRNGFEISGSSNSIVGCAARGNETGFYIFGAKGKYVDNTASGNQTGFYLAGSSLKAMRNVAANNTFNGFQIQGSGAKLQDNIASGNVAGFSVEANDTSLKSNLASANTGVGFRCDLGTKGHKLKANSASGGNVGFSWFACDDTDFLKNVATSNESSGFEVRGDGCKLVGNVATANGVGIGVFGAGNKLSKNAVSGNGTGILIEAYGAGGNDIKGNRTLGNSSGMLFAAGGGTDNRAASNISLGNLPGIDLGDFQGPPCTDMTWVDNIFRTSTAPCIE